MYRTGQTSPPSPVRMVEVDLDQPMPGLARILGSYDQGWVIARRRGVPQGIVEVASTHPELGLRQLAALVEAAPVLASGVDLPDVALPMISVVVPTVVARLGEIELLLRGFDRLDYPRYEIILVDNRRALPTPDPLPDLVGDRAHVRVVREPQPGISAARNTGVAAAFGEIVAFTDDDVRVDPGWLRAIGRRFSYEPALAAVTGLILPAELETPAQIWFERYYGGFSGERTFAPLTLEAERAPRRPWRRARVAVRTSDGEVKQTAAIYGVGAYGAGANMAYRRSALRTVGGFDLALGTGTAARGGEDLAALIDVLWTGGQLGYEPAAVVHHTHRREQAELLHQLRGNGVGFTAMLTSLVLRRPGHLAGLLAQLPLAAQRKARQSVDRFGSKPTGTATPEAAATDVAYPRDLVLHELRGMPKGPLAYLRSRAAVRRYAARAAPRRP